MKTMLMFDLLTAKKLARSQLLLGVVVALVLTVSTGSALCIMPIMALMLAYSVGFTLVAFDERNDWERFRLTLPLSRANVVQGRYATFVVMTLVGLVLGVAVTAIVYGLSLALPQTELFAGLFEGMDWQIVLGMVAASIAFSLALWLVALPLVARFGMTKAVRYLPLIVVIGVMLLLTGLKDFEAPAFLLDFIAWVATPAGTVAVAAGTLIIMLVLYAVSATVAVKLYAKREL